MEAEKSPSIFYRVVLYYEIFTPFFTKSLGEITTKRPSLSSADKIIPSLAIPLSFRGSKLAIKHTCFPIKSAGWYY